MTYDDNMTKQVDNINNVTYTYEYDKDGNTTAVKGSNGFNILYSDEELAKLVPWLDEIPDYCRLKKAQQK